MDHIRIIRRAFEIVRRYPVLWIFGFLLALTTSRGSGGGSNSGFQLNGGDFSPDRWPGRWLDRWPERWPGGLPYVPQEIINTVIGAFVAIFCFVLVLAVVFTIIRYVALTASIRMVDRYETDGEKLRFGQGWRLGWTRAAFRMWLVDLMFGFGAFLVVILLFLVAAAPLLLLISGTDVANVIGIVTTIGLGFLAILIVILFAAALSLLLHFIHRAIALENMGVFDGIRRGWYLVRRRLGDVIIMGLILFGIGLLFTILLIPVGLIMVVVSAAAGGLPALLTWAITNVFAQGDLPVILAVVVGLPLFILVLTIPLAFLSGLLEIFNSSAWTLTYREVLALENVQEEEQPA